jgi:glycosyltransferase involved in cell wall biosynthesis
MQNRPPLISVITTSFNRKRKLKRAIDSVFEQTFKDFELIVVDDASTDDSWDYLIGLKSNKLQAYRLEDNVKQAKATNYAVEKAVGTYIAFLDADDFWAPDFLETLVTKGIYQARSQSIAAFYCGSNVIDDLGNVIRTNHAKSGIAPVQDIKNRNVVGPQSRVILRKNVYVELLGLDVELPACKDWDLWIRVSNLGFDFLGINTVKVSYEENTEAISSNLQTTLAGRYMIWDKHFDFDNHHELLVQQYCLFAKFLFNRGHRNAARRILKEARSSSPFNLLVEFYYFATFAPVFMVRYFYRFAR